MKSTYFLMHGSFGSPFSNWTPWLRTQIESNGGEVYTPDMPSGVGFQNYDNWEKIMKCYVSANIINENTIIFAHSIAPVFICKFLVQNKIKVKRLVFVCGFNNYLGIDENYDTVNKTMYFDNLSDIKKYCTDIVCFYSDNDPYVKYDSELTFANAITNNHNMIKNGGHLNSESGYNEFPELLKYL